MKIILTLTICSSLLLSTYLMGSNPLAKDLSPEDVVRSYVELSEAGKFEEIKTLASGIPKSYEDADFEDFCRRTRELRQVADKTTNFSENSSPKASVPTAKEDLNPTTDVLIDEPELIRSKGDYFKQTISVV